MQPKFWLENHISNRWDDFDEVEITIASANFPRYGVRKSKENWPLDNLHQWPFFLFEMLFENYAAS